MPSELNEALGRIGFRRSQSVAYRPSCIDCSACVSVRVLAAEFEPSATQRKLLRRHADLEVSACKPWTTEEQYALLRRYLAERHPGGGMAEMDESDFADMVEQTPVRTYVIEYREPSVDGRPGQAGRRLPERPAGRRPVSMIYSFFDVGPSARKGLGTYIILDHIIRAARAGLPYVYLGYWVEGSNRMAYKTGFRPLERLGRDGWRRMDEQPATIVQRRSTGAPDAAATAKRLHRGLARLAHIRQPIAATSTGGEQRGFQRADDDQRRAGRARFRRTNAPIGRAAGVSRAHPAPAARGCRHQPPAGRADERCRRSRRRGWPRARRRRSSGLRRATAAETDGRAKQALRPPR